MSAVFRARRPDSGLGNIQRSFADPARNVDWILMGAVSVLSVIGLFLIYSATRPALISNGLDPYRFVQRQIIFAIIAIAVMIAVMWMDYVQLRGSAQAFYVGTVFLLVLVLVIGGVKGGATLSFDVGPIAIQPSELAKVVTMLTLAGYLADDDRDYVPWEVLVRSLVIVGIPALLVVREPDLGSASVLVACAMGMLLVAGAQVKYILAITGMGIASAVAGVMSGVVKTYQIKRVTAFLYQNSNSADLQNVVNQVKFAKRAVSTGGFWGKGYLQGPLTNGRFIPVQSTDFVFSALGEQFGMIGCALVLGLYGVILWRIYRISRIANEKLGVLVCAGVFTMILWQTFQNIGMTMGIMPVTGVPLPFLSYGGSSLVAFAILVGLVESVHMRRMR